MPKTYNEGTRDKVTSAQQKAHVYREMGQNTYSGGGSSDKDGYTSTKLPER